METATAVMAEIKRLVGALSEEERGEVLDMIEFWVDDVLYPEGYADDEEG